MSGLSPQAVLSFETFDSRRSLLRHALDFGGEPRQDWQVIGDVGSPAGPCQAQAPRQVANFNLERRSYGYDIHKVEHLPSRGKLVHMVAGGLALGMWLFLANLLQYEPATWRVPQLAYPMAMVVFGLAVILLHRATRGLLSHIEVDLAQGELREGLHHAIGRPTLLRRTRFDAVQDLRLTVPDAAGTASLICVISGPQGPAAWRLARGPVVKLALLEDLMRQHLQAVSGHVDQDSGAST